MRIAEGLSIVEKIRVDLDKKVLIELCQICGCSTTGKKKDLVETLKNSGFDCFYFSAKTNSLVASNFTQI